MRNILIASVLLLLFTGCMAKDSFSDDLDEVDLIELDDESVELSILIFYQSSENTLSIDEYVEAYTSKYPDVQIKLEYAPIRNSTGTSNFNETMELLNYIDEFQPDIVEVFPFHLHMLGDQLLDLNEYFQLEGLSKDDLYPVLLDATSKDGELLALPTYYDMQFMYYNKDAFEEHNIPFPQEGWTWEEVLELNDKLGVGVWYSPLVIEQIVRSYGGHLLSPVSYEADGYLNSNKTREALQWIVDNLNETNDPSILDSDIGPTRLNFLHPYKGEPYAYTSFPYLHGGERITPILVGGLGIMRDSENRDEAWRFIRESWIDNNEVSQYIAQTEYISTRKSVTASSGMDQTPIGRLVLEELAFAEPSTIRFGYGVTTFIDRNFTYFNMLREEKSIDEIISPMIAQWEEELRGLMFSSFK